MRRKLALAALLGAAVSLLLGVTDITSQNREVIIARLSAYQPFTSGNCGRSWYTLSEAACNAASTKIYPTDDFTLTRISGAPALDSWGGTEACDLDLLVGGTGGNGTAVATLLAGGTGFRALGEGAFTTQFSSREVAAGTLLQIKHTDPGSDYCIAGAACDCDGAIAGYIVTIWGVRH